MQPHRELREPQGRPLFARASCSTGAAIREALFSTRTKRTPSLNSALIWSGLTTVGNALFCLTRPLLANTAESPASGSRSSERLYEARVPFGPARHPRRTKRYPCFIEP